MEYIENEWLAWKQQADNPSTLTSDDPSAMIRECLEEGRDEAPTPPKASSSRGLSEPDVTVVVSGITFRHHGILLSLSSKYFDEFLKSGTKQSKLKLVVEFPDKDPEEWKQVAKFFEPLCSPTAGRITKENIDMLLPWFDFLKMNHLQEAAEKWILRNCLPPPGVDHILVSRVRPGEKARLPLGSNNTEAIEFWQRGVEDLCMEFLLSVRYGFMKLKKVLRDLLCIVLIQSPDFFTMASINTLVSALMNANIDQDTKEQVWMSLKVYIPQTVVEMSNDDLLANHLFPGVILYSMQLSTVAARAKAFWRPSLLPHCS